jgi:hypothetical protein
MKLRRADAPPLPNRRPCMTALQIFLEELWPTFIVSAIVFPLVWLGRVISLDRNASTIGPKYFAELTTFPKDEQRRLLHTADRNAFPGWRLVIPALIYSALYSGSIAAGQTLRKAGIIPDSFWMSTGTSVVLLGLGSLAVRRFEARRLRPFLASVINRTAGAADDRQISNTR